ncbi:MAG: DUF1614 domain-containing protein [Rhodospirillales bacterium]|nr:DUF1614 domain-containing protein [Acetobacter sp.]
MDHLQGLSAPVASIAGAGKYDAIFLMGLIDVLSAGLWEKNLALSQPMEAA